VTENGTWELVKLLPGCKAIGLKWVFKVKRNADSSIKCYKACLVAQGFSQRPGIDFDKTFAPTAKWAALHTIFALAALKDWEVESIDISNMYLNGKLHNVEVYMRHPEGFNNCNSTWVAHVERRGSGGCGKRTSNNALLCHTSRAYILVLITHAHEAPQLTLSCP
jgi:hypothetical protein